MDVVELICKKFLEKITSKEKIIYLLSFCVKCIPNIPLPYEISSKFSGEMIGFEGSLNIKNTNVNLLKN